MALNAGDRLGPYEILAPIGSGGMGQVYRARDTRLGRDVAIKVSAERFSERFEREARLIGALNHPNVCTLHDVGPNYLVMELVEGPTLAERIRQGALPLHEALAIARQIADALEAAHEKGIVHRDLKPGNVKVKPDGAVKVLDFGLAKVGGLAEARPPDDSPTISMAATQAGMILGTAAYMSPEQARGKPVDERADIWAFGVLLYEMVAGRKLFKGNDVSDTLAAVIRDEPKWSEMPAQIRPLLHRCLEKDPKRRLRHIGDAMPMVTESAEPQPPAGARLPWLWSALAALATAVALMLAFGYFRGTAPAIAAPVRFQVPAPDQNSFDVYLSLSPNGRQLAFTAQGPDGASRIWVRSLENLEARVLPGTEGAASAFWSPDSRFLAFSDGTSKLKRIDASGNSPAQTICDVQGTPGSGSWGDNGIIIFGGRGAGPIRKVPAAGGTPTEITAVDNQRSETFHGFPWLLPDGKHFLYLRTSTDPNLQGLYLGSVDATPAQQPLNRLLATQINAIYVPSARSKTGYVLFQRDGTLTAQAFDAGRLVLAGEPIPVAEHVGMANNVYGFFTASRTGLLAFRNGDAGGSRQLTWFDRKGKVLGSAAEAGQYNEIELSPDGRRAATYQDIGQADLWLLDFARSTSARFTFATILDRYPVWSPDGSQIAFSSGSSSVNSSIYRKSSNLASEAELLIKGGASPQDWSPDGHYLLYQVQGTNGRDLWVLPLAAGGKPVSFVSTPFTETQGRFSPDGRWVAYSSNESGRFEVYVRPFSPSAKNGSMAGEGVWLVSNGGGVQPRWRRDGKELLYLSPSSKLMSVEVSAAGAAFQPGVPKPLLDTFIFGGANNATLTARWDLTGDGQKFLITTNARTTNSSPIMVVENWMAGLEKK